MRRISFIAATGLALVLAACGGGGSSDSPPAQPPVQPPTGGGGTTQAVLPPADTYPIDNGNRFGYLELAADGSYVSNMFRPASVGGVFTHKGQLKQVTPPAAVFSDPSLQPGPENYSFWGMVTLTVPEGDQVDFYLAYRTNPKNILLLGQYKVAGLDVIRTYWLNK